MNHSLLYIPLFSHALLFCSILRLKELKEVIEYEQLEALLPENVLKQLEEQCLTQIEVSRFIQFQFIISSSREEG